MERENLFNLYVEAYFGVREMDEYDLKEYVLKLKTCTTPSHSR